MRIIDAEKLKAHYSWWGDTEERSVFDVIVDAQPTVEAVDTEAFIAWLDKRISDYENANGLYSEDAETRELAKILITELLQVKAYVKGAQNDTRIED